MGAFDKRLVGAAQRARDDLRMVILPGLAKLEPMLAGSPESVALVRHLCTLAHAHADSLRLAMKDRKLVPRREADVPCWTRK